jgi:hypothetical protein
VFWKTIWKPVLPAPLEKFAVVVFNWLVAQAGTEVPADAVAPLPPVPVPDPAEPPPVAESAVAPPDAVPPEAVPEPAPVDDEPDEPEEEAEEEDAEAEEEPDALLSSGPHAASVKPAVASMTTNVPVRTVLVRMVLAFPV